MMTDRSDCFWSDSASRGTQRAATTLECSNVVPRPERPTTSPYSVGATSSQSEQTTGTLSGVGAYGSKMTFMPVPAVELQTAASATKTRCSYRLSPSQRTGVGGAVTIVDYAERC
jgi:hypothetical protein